MKEILYDAIHATLAKAGSCGGNEDFPVRVNAHIHTPYSFSAFKDVEHPFRMAVEEGIGVLGINDFYTTDGYSEFAEFALKYRIFPLFNIEFMALQKDEQLAGIRVNDPQNPGRTYISGKGLRFPVSMGNDSARKMTSLQEESNRQTYQMMERLNEFLASIGAELHFDAETIHKLLARNLFRERHIAAAIRQAVMEKFSSGDDIRSAFKAIFSGFEPSSDLANAAQLENEIRNRLLKAGGPAYVPEDEKAFLSLPEVISLIRDAGGIPCYPVLLDDVKGNFTDFEGDFEALASTLREKEIYMIELIPGRNDAGILKKFVHFFDTQGFVVTFGSEHNTPQLDPLTITCRNAIPLDEPLLEINYRGAAIIAAHQYLVFRGESGFPANHFPAKETLDDLAALGKKIISCFINPSYHE